MQPYNRKDRELFARAKHAAWLESWRNIARRFLLNGRSLAPFVILLIILLAIAEHHRIQQMG